MAFYVGQKVVAVGHKGQTNPNSVSTEDAKRAGAILPKIGSVYTIRAIDHHRSWTAVRLVEIDNSHLTYWRGATMEPGFRAEAFRPVVERKTDISIFKAMLNPADKRVEA